MLHFLALCGSLRARSSNLTLLEAGILVAPDGIAMALYDGLPDLPAFNPDQDDRPQSTVTDWRERVMAADGIVVSSPEYARGVPGALKNALDWLVSDTRFNDKPVALWHAAPATRGESAKAQLDLILTTMSARLVADASVTVPLQSQDLRSEQVAADPRTRQTLQSALHALAKAVAGRTG